MKWNIKINVVLECTADRFSDAMGIARMAQAHVQESLITSPNFKHSPPKVVKLDTVWKEDRQ